MRNLVAVKFIKARLPYKKGDVAGFEKDLADKYIAKGFAEPLAKKSVDAPKVDKAIKSPKKKK